MDTEQPHTAFGECPVTTATFSKQGEMTHVRYKATRVRSWSDSNYNYTVTSHYAVIRGGNIGFERVPVDGSTKMADNLMESIEPFDFSDEVDFQTAYLAGYLADKYDVDEQQSIDRANQRIKQSAADAFSGTVRHAGATTIHITAEKKGDSVSVKITNDGRLSFRTSQKNRSFPQPNNRNLIILSRLLLESGFSHTFLKKVLKPVLRYRVQWK